MKFVIVEIYNPEKSFIEQYGAIQYTQHIAKKYREYTEDTGLCEMCSGYGTRHRVIVDHCHKHGWIRGFICNSCNTLLGKYEYGTWTVYDVLSCPHIHWKYQYFSGKISEQSITNYEKCALNIEQNIRIHETWITQINKCPECQVTMPAHKLPELLETIPDGIAQSSHSKGQISAEYLRQLVVKIRATSHPKITHHPVVFPHTIECEARVPPGPSSLYPDSCYMQSNKSILPNS
jgi:hypothetical protein